LIGGEMLEELYLKEILRSKEEKRILKGNISGIEDEYYKLKNKNIPCAIVWYGDIKVLIPISHLIQNKESKSLIRGMLGAEIDFIVLEFDEVANIAIGSRLEAMKIRSSIEIPKLKINESIRVRIIAVGVKHIIVDMYGKEVIIKADNLKHTYIVNCKEIYKVGDYLQVRIKNIDITNNIYELSAKDYEENPFKNIRKYISLNGEYTGTVIAFPKKNSGILVQLDNSNVTCLVRVPARFNFFPHFKDKVLIKVTEIKEDKKFIYGYLMRII
jgi:small subunit ribosomal protein S1